MVEFKIVIGDPKSKKTYQKTLGEGDVDKLIGKKIGDKFRGELVELPGYELQITGGSDNAGFPMRKSVDGSGRKKILTGKGVGFRDIVKHKKGEKVLRIKKPGKRKRKTVHGNTVSDATAQVNCKVVKEGKDPVAKLLGAEKKEAPAEEKTEAKTEEKVEEKEEKQKEEKKEEPTEEKSEEALVEETKEEPKEEKKEEPKEKAEK